MPDFDPEAARWYESSRRGERPFSAPYEQSGLVLVCSIVGNDGLVTEVVEGEGEVRWMLINVGQHRRGTRELSVYGEHGRTDLPAATNPKKVAIQYLGHREDLQYYQRFMASEPFCVREVGDESAWTCLRRVENIAASPFRASKVAGAEVPPEANSVPGQSAVVQKKKLVAICYAHQDNEGEEQWVERLKTFLAPVESTISVQAWADTQIELGSHWEHELLASLESATAVICLVSPSFLASEFIRHREMPIVLRKHDEGALSVLPIILKPCLVSSSPYKFPDPDTGPGELTLDFFQGEGNSKPLSGLSEHEQDESLNRVATRIRELLESPE